MFIKYNGNANNKFVAVYEEADRIRNKSKMLRKTTEESKEIKLAERNKKKERFLQKEGGEK